ncbi:LpxL/LpxP family acyltransferase [Ornithinimicrobium avium]|uniref:LpxL/LpxP family acyltransferase n=1 Tax=Ornithinimicrobium avium TaxID=2283195 RepID=UPI0013B36E74|nr:hypothetical protein [Ornithinimicrobium avium]
MILRDLGRTYRAVRPDLRGPALLGLTVRGTLAYGAYWARLGTLPWLGRAQIDRLVHGVGLDDVLEGMASRRGQVLVLLHLGHFELAGAWAAPRLGGLTTVAEELPPGPAAVLTARARAAAGLEVVPAGSGSAGARRLLSVLHAGGAVALLVDRDLADRGMRSRRVPVQIGGLATTFAAGPAELALATGADLRPVSVTTSGRGAPRHQVRFGAAVPVGSGPRAEQVEQMTRACAEVLGEAVLRRTQDWHLTRLPAVAPPAGVRP